jgi:hypothetical protein
MANLYIRFPSTTFSGSIGTVTAEQPNGALFHCTVDASALPTGAATLAAQTDGSQKTQLVDKNGLNLTTTLIGSKDAIDVNIESSTSQDVFGTDIASTRYNQIEINFESAPGATYITNTASGGGGVTYSNGHALYETGTAVTAESKGVSVKTIEYRPGAEVYSLFTAAFTLPTSVDSYQRIGIYDSTNGFFIGYNGTSFGLTLRNNSIDTFVNRSSWNGDLLTGAAGSAFTRNNSPEAINLQYSNLFRIRFGWLGSASIFFDVMSPDGVWVNFHTVKQPNTSLNPSLTNPNLPMTVDVSKTSSDATNLIIYTACWAGGATSSYTKITDTISDTTLASITRSVITGVTTGGGGGYVNVKVNPSGALVADVTGSVTVSGTVAATQSGTWNINNVSGTISLPTGAATETTLSTLNGKVTACNTGNVTVAASALPTGAATESTLSTLNGKVTACDTGNVTVSASALPTGAATSAKQPALGTAGTASSDVITVQGISGMTALKVDGSAVTQPVSQSGTWSVKPGGLAKANDSVYNDYATNMVDTTSYNQLVPSLSSAVQWVDIFDSSGQAMILATGAAGAEVNVAYIPPGGISLNIAIAASTRISIKGLTGNAISGYILLNFRG